MKIFIKNMVCNGTKSFVIQELEELGFKYNTFESGEIDFVKDLSKSDKSKIDQSLQKYGLELSFEKTNLVSKIRQGFLI
jgi:hypothetical protein